MTPEKIVVTIGGLILIGFIYWFFFGKKENESESTTIIVEGGYKPGTIRIKRGLKTTLTFIRRDPNSCLEELIIPDFKIKKYLPINTKVEVDLFPKEKGEYEFHCGMNMYHGKLIVN